MKYYYLVGVEEKERAMGQVSGVEELMGMGGGVRYRLS